MYLIIMVEVMFLMIISILFLLEKIYRSINSLVGCQNIQKDLDALTKWEKD